MVLHKDFIAFVLAMFVTGGVAAPLSVDRANGLRLAPNAVEVGNHKDMKAKKEKTADDRTPGNGNKGRQEIGAGGASDDGLETSFAVFAENAGLRFRYSTSSLQQVRNRG